VDDSVGAVVRDSVGAKVGAVGESVGAGQSLRQMDTSALLDPLMSRTSTFSVIPDPSKLTIWYLPPALSFATSVDGA
jgi:hypothetical protein